MKNIISCKVIKKNMKQPQYTFYLFRNYMDIRLLINEDIILALKNVVY